MEPNNIIAIPTLEPLTRIDLKDHDRIEWIDLEGLQFAVKIKNKARFYPTSSNHFNLGEKYTTIRSLVAKMILPNMMFIHNGKNYIISETMTDFFVDGTHYKTCKNLPWTFADANGNIVTTCSRKSNYLAIKKPELHKSGYNRVKTKAGRFFVHRLVMDAWNPSFNIHDTYIDYSVDHIDANRVNNKVENLRVMSMIENVKSMHNRLKSNLDICSNFENSKDIIWD